MLSPVRPNLRSRVIAAAAAGAVLLGVGATAHAAQYWDLKSLLKSFFSTSQRVTYKKVVLDDATASQIAKETGASIKKEWEIYVGERDGQRNGFAVVDQEKGMHEPIDFAVQFTPSGAVERVEIVAYREAYGDEVRSSRFREQFKGKTAHDPISVGKDIDIVSGASISSRSVAVGVKRDAMILDAAMKSGSL